MPLVAPCCGQIASRRWRSQLRVAGIRYTTCRRVQEIVGSRRRACFFGLGFRRGTFFPVSESKTGGANAFIGGRSIRLVSYNEASTSAAGCPESDDATRAYSDCSPAHRITSGYTLRSSLRCGARSIVLSRCSCGLGAKGRRVVRLAAPHSDKLPPATISRSRFALAMQVCCAHGRRGNFV